MYYLKGLPDGKDMLCGFYVSSINEWKLHQPRYLLLSKTAFYRATYSHKSGKVEDYTTIKLSKLRVIEKTASGLKLYLTEQDGNASLGKKMMGFFNQSKPKDEFEHARDYIPKEPTSGPAQTSASYIVDVMAAAFHKTAELCSASGGGFPVPSLLTTQERKGILAERKEAERLEKERVEREAASADLETAIKQATESRTFELLKRPLARCKKAVGVDGELIARAEKLDEELKEEKKERELQERLAKEAAEREAAGKELADAVEAARTARNAAPPEPQEGGAAAMAAAAKLLDKPIKRATKAVDFSAEALEEAKALKAELDELEKARKAAERLERERKEREEATAELQAAIEACTESREPAAVVKALKRARKAVNVSPELLAQGDGLKAACDDEKRQAAADEKAAKAEAAAAAKAEAAEKAAAKAKAEADAKAEASAKEDAESGASQPAAAEAAEAAEAGDAEAGPAAEAGDAQ